MTEQAMSRFSGSTGTSTSDKIKDYATVIPIGTRGLSIRVDDIRTRAEQNAGQAQDLQNQARALNLDAWTRNKSRHDVSSLLDELAYQRGMAWTHIAEIAGVSVSAVRKWRKGKDASPESRGRLAKFAALLDTLEADADIEDPATWMEMELPLGSGYYIRPLDLYVGGQIMALFDLAEQRKPAEYILDGIQPGWRDTRSKFEVFDDTDGMRSIRKRDE